MTLVFLFSTNHSVTVYPRIFWKGVFDFMEVIYSEACGVDVHKKFIVAVICDSSTAKPKYIRKRFSTFNSITSWLLLKTGLSITTVRMYAWKVPASIISLYTMHWKVLSPMSSLPILNRSKLLKVRKMIIKMQNGLLIFLSLVLLYSS